MNIEMIVIGDPQLWGIVPSFLDPENPASAIEQIDAHYQGGWHPLKGFKIEETEDGVTLTYGEGEDSDPPLPSLGALIFRDETLYITDYEWVVAKNAEGEWEACRLD